MRSYRYFVFTAAIAVFLTNPSALWAQATAPPLGAAGSFGVLGGSAVTAAGGAGTVVDGNVGSSPTPTVTGFPPAVVTPGNTVYTAADAVTANARIAATAARLNLAGQVCPPANVIVGGNLGGLNLVPGVYCMPTASLVGTLTLTGAANAVWVFQVTLDTLTTAAASNIVMAGGASACNVFWQVSSSATLGSGSTFRGSIFAGASITIGTTATVVGRAIAGTGAVSLDGSNTVGGGCSAAQPPGCPVTTLNPNVLANGSLGNIYSQTLTLTGGAGGATFTAVPGTLPAGLTLSLGGVLSGTPTVAVPQTFTIRGTDVNGCFAQRSFTVFIVDSLTPPPAGCPVITLSPTTIPNGAVGVAYSQQLATVGGVSPFTFTRTAGGLLPSGLTLSSSGLISGTPTTAISDDFVIRATDVNGCFTELSFVMSILAGVPTLPQAFVVVMLLGLLLIGYAQLRNRARV